MTAPHPPEPLGRRLPIVEWRAVPVHPGLAMALGTVGVLATGAVLIPFRETVGAVGVALAMALLVMLAAEFGGRSAGVVVGIVASLTFNVLHTRPYYALVIDDQSEAIAAALLAVMGFIIGDVASHPSELVSAGESWKAEGASSPRSPGSASSPSPPSSPSVSVVACAPGPRMSLPSRRWRY